MCACVCVIDDSNHNWIDYCYYYNVHEHGEIRGKTAMHIVCICEAIQNHHSFFYAGRECIHNTSENVQYYLACKTYERRRNQWMYSTVCHTSKWFILRDNRFVAMDAHHSWSMLCLKQRFELKPSNLDTQLDIEAKYSRNEWVPFIFILSRLLLQLRRIYIFFYIPCYSSRQHNIVISHRDISIMRCHMCIWSAWMNCCIIF